MKDTNPWKYVQIDLEELKDNPYLHPQSNPSSPIPTTLPATSPAPATPSVTSSLDYLILHDISCVDANGTIFEHYDELKIAKDIFRDQQNQQLTFTPYNAVVHCEQNGLFLPSFALTCNIVAALFKHAVRLETKGTYTTLNQDAKKVLDQYKDKGNGNGWHAQNTIINYDTQQVIHYPTATDFGNTTAVNTARQKFTGTFTKAALEDSLLENALKDTAHLQYVKQLTGLADPFILVEIGKYFGKSTKLWFPWNGKTGATQTGTRAAWFGCSNASLNLNSDYDLNLSGAVRGVR